MEAQKVRRSQQHVETPIEMINRSIGVSREVTSQRRNKSLKPLFKLSIALLKLIVSAFVKPCCVVSPSHQTQARPQSVSKKLLVENCELTLNDILMRKYASHSDTKKPVISITHALIVRWSFLHRSALSPKDKLEEQRSCSSKRRQFGVALLHLLLRRKREEVTPRTRMTGFHWCSLWLPSNLQCQV